LRGYAAIGLDNPKNNINVGAALRAAGVYGAALCFMIAWRKVENELETDRPIPH
jgi:hypothetical protein